MHILLRLEAAFVAILAAGIYWKAGLNWWLFLALFLVPDISMLGYLKGPRVGAAIYNAFHVYFVALALASAGWLSGSQTLLSVGIIWIFHIALDRALGYGLKSPASFHETHLGKIGRG